MIFVNNFYKLEKFNTNNVVAIFDFDKTLTDGFSMGSWGLLMGSAQLPKTFSEEMNRLYNYYRPIEVDPTISLDEKKKILPMWWQKNIELLIQYNVKKEMIKESIYINKFMKFREGAKLFLYQLYSFNIPVIILSAGIGNFIEEFLIKENCYFDNIKVISNNLKFENDFAIGLSNELIHSLNKNEIILEDNISCARDKNILFGDSLGDLDMVQNSKSDNTFSIGFHEVKNKDSLKEYKQNFDIVCTKNTSYTRLLKRTDILKHITR